MNKNFIFQTLQAFNNFKAPGLAWGALRATPRAQTLQNLKTHLETLNELVKTFKSPRPGLRSPEGHPQRSDPAKLLTNFENLHKLLKVPDLAWGALRPFQGSDPSKLLNFLKPLKLNF